MTRKDLVDALRVLKETDTIVSIKTTSKRIEVRFHNATYISQIPSLLIIPHATPNHPNTPKHSGPQGPNPLRQPEGR